ncbi:MAG: hypothetical protein ACLUNZ_07290 [Evtepia sp.]
MAAIISGTGLMLTHGQAPLRRDDGPCGRLQSLPCSSGRSWWRRHVLCCLSFLQSIPLSVLTAVCMGVGYLIATIGPSVWANDLASPGSTRLFCGGCK